jgi:hypothetical protein
MDVTKPNFVEAAIDMATDGEEAGQFVARCAKDECGYFCQSMYAYWSQLVSDASSLSAPGTIL